MGILRRPGLLAGAFIIGATLPAGDSFVIPGPPRAWRPTPITLVHGTADPIVPYAGGEMHPWMQRLFRVGGRSESAPATAAILARRNGIDGDPAVVDLPPGRDAGRGVSITRTTYAGPGLPSVGLVTVHGGGHTVPGPRRGTGIVGRTARGISVADLVREAVDSAALEPERPTAAPNPRT